MIDFTTVLLDLDDQPCPDEMTMQSNGGKFVALTLGRAAAHALLFQDDAKATSEDKFRQGLLAFKVRDDAQCELKVEDIALIKAQIAKIYSPLIVYRTFPLLDGAESG